MIELIVDSGMAAIDVDVTETEIVAVINQRPIEITGTEMVGPQGPPGERGVPGGGFFYVHVQSAASVLWDILHNLNGFPVVTAVQAIDVDTEEKINGIVSYKGPMRVQIDFGAIAVAGRAFLS